MNCVRWKQNGVFEEKRNSYFEESRKIYGEGMCSVKLVDKKNTEDLMNMLGLKEATDKLAKVNGMRWYSHVLR